MTTTLAKTKTGGIPKQSALATMAGRLNVDSGKLLETLKATAFKGASDPEMMALCIVANEYRLNPLTKEIYAFPAKGGGIQPIVSIDGWLRIINEHPQLDGFEFEYHEDDGGQLVSVTCRIHRKDRKHPIEVTEFVEECRRATEPWKMVRRMMRHKALIQCARYAFGFSGITDEDEAEGMRNVTPPAKESPRVKIDPFEPAEPEQVEAPAEQEDGEGELI